MCAHVGFREGEALNCLSMLAEQQGLTRSLARGPGSEPGTDAMQDHLHHPLSSLSHGSCQSTQRNNSMGSSSSLKKKSLIYLHLV